MHQAVVYVFEEDNHPTVEFVALVNLILVSRNSRGSIIFHNITATAGIRKLEDESQSHNFNYQGGLLYTTIMPGCYQLYTFSPRST